MLKSIATTTEVIAKMQPGDKLEVTQLYPDTQPLPPFLMLGRRGKTKANIHGFDTVDVVKDLSRFGANMFWRMVQARTLETNLCKVGHDIIFDDKDRQRMKRIGKELRERRLVIGVQRNVYLINPKAVIPQKKFFERTWAEWVKACEKRNLDPDPPYWDGAPGGGFKLSNIPY